MVVLMDGEIIIVIFAVAMLGMGVGSIINHHTTDIGLAQETGDDVCRQLIGNETAEASSESGKLICTIPSFDSTQNIIVKTNNE